MLSGSVCLSFFVAACHALINIKHKAIVIFKNICSPPARSPIMVAKEIGLELELKWVMNRAVCLCFIPVFLWREIDFINSEHMSESFTKVERKGSAKCGTSSRTKANSIDRSIRLKPYRLWSMETLLFVTGRPNPRRITGWISKGRGSSLPCAYLSPSHRTPSASFPSSRLAFFSVMPSIFTWLKSMPQMTISTRNMIFSCVQL